MNCKHVPAHSFGLTVFSSHATCRECGKRIELERPIVIRFRWLCVFVTLFHFALACIYCYYKRLWASFVLMLLGCGADLLYLLYYSGKYARWRLRRETSLPYCARIKCRHLPANPAIIHPINIWRPLVDAETQKCKFCGCGIKPKNISRLRVIALISTIIQFTMIHEIIECFFALTLNNYSTSTIQAVVQDDRLYFLNKFIINDVIEILLFFATFLFVGYLSKWENSADCLHSEGKQ